MPTEAAASTDAQLDQSPSSLVSHVFAATVIYSERNEFSFKLRVNAATFSVNCRIAQNHRDRRTLRAPPRDLRRLCLSEIDIVGCATVSYSSEDPAHPNPRGIPARRSASRSSAAGTRADVASTAWIIARVPWAGARQSRIGVGWGLPRDRPASNLGSLRGSDRLKLRCSRAMAMVQPWHSVLFTVGP